MTLNLIGVPLGTVKLLKVAVKLCWVPCAEFGDTFDGLRLNPGNGLLEAKSHVPSAAVILRMRSLCVMYAHPSGPVIP